MSSIVVKNGLKYKSDYLKVSTDYLYLFYMSLHIIINYL